MRTITRFFGSDGAEQVPCDASAAVRETFFDDGRLLKREVIKANRTTLANAQATAAIFSNMELANLGTTEGAVKGWETRRHGGQPVGLTGLEGQMDWRTKNSEVQAVMIPKLVEQVDTKGGFTYYPAHGSFPADGYSVSAGKKNEEVIKPGQWAKHKLELVKSYCDRKKDVLAGDLKAHIGAWFDPETKKVFLDVVHVYPEKENAMAQGRAIGEKAIYDLKNKETLTVK